MPVPNATLTALTPVYSSTNANQVPGKTYVSATEGVSIVYIFIVTFWYLN